MKPLALLILFALAVALAHAAPEEKSFIHTTPAQLKKLSKLHEEAHRRILLEDYRGAVRLYEEILFEEPDDAAAYTGMGHAYRILGDFERAKAAFLNALHINPDNESAMYGFRKIQDPDGTPDWTENEE